MAHFQTVRFHKSIGPASLFARVHQKMATKKGLRLHGGHFQQRASERHIAEEMLQDFPSDAWELMEAEVRADTGKFVATSWRKNIENHFLWVVVGFEETVKTAYWGTHETPHPDTERESSFYFFVEEVNRRLFDEDNQNSSETATLRHNTASPQPTTKTPNHDTPLSDLSL